MAKERKRLINEDMVQDQPTTIPARVGQSNRTPGRDNMGQEEVTANLMSDACITFPFFQVLCIDTVFVSGCWCQWCEKSDSRGEHSSPRPPWLIRLLA